MPQLMPISCIIFRTVLSAMTAPSSARRHIAIWRCPHPFGERLKISTALSHSSGLVGAFAGLALL